MDEFDEGAAEWAARYLALTGKPSRLTTAEWRALVLASDDDVEDDTIVAMGT